VTFLDDEFDPIGASAIGNTHLYTGRERDPETGLQLNRHRFYAAHLGRWANRDPIGYAGGDYNLYEYVRGNSIIGSDPTGEYLACCVYRIPGQRVWQETLDCNRFEMSLSKCCGCPKGAILLGAHWGACNSPTLPPPPNPCAQVKGTSMFAPTAPAGGWDLKNIRECYEGCVFCNDDKRGAPKCGQCLKYCLGVHASLCAKDAAKPGKPRPQQTVAKGEACLTVGYELMKIKLADPNCRETDYSP
jgi:RHS repeat-associated protein